MERHVIPFLSSLRGESHFRVRFYSGGCWMGCDPIGKVRGRRGELKWKL